MILLHKLANIAPQAKKTDRKLSIFLSLFGRNSRKRGPFTGRLPPTPTPRQNNVQHNNWKLGERPVKRPKNVVIANVESKASFLPYLLTRQHLAVIRNPRKPVTEKSPEEISQHGACKEEARY
jgi:hypothetical protein